MFEKFLPFAMALGVEKKWAGAFQDIYREPPEWYRGSYGPNFYTMGFVHDMDQMTTRAGSVLSSAPRSSGGSGFGGGGGSGGGFGGGGGGDLLRGAEELRQVVIPRSLRRRGNSQGAASRANEDTRAG